MPPPAQRASISGRMLAAPVVLHHIQPLNDDHTGLRCGQGCCMGACWTGNLAHHEAGRPGHCGPFKDVTPADTAAKTAGLCDLWTLLEFYRQA